ncbi:PREDICTED: solute carrier family 35 member C2 [Nicrophorus vespilloides]|uniref:Solute carrier family 35 member C2 n=1 Tax=Nicrophorus vespilloides TaxID=110193 RepID=A0ABM1MWU0_NICVS|nr:PREDICTED: solute carrier family 35 member C2 [Nicrophorus vespilloides]
MLGRRAKAKYDVLRRDVEGEEVEIDFDVQKLKRKVFTPACIWQSFMTVILISIYFAPSIGLTFYQRWLLQQFKFPLSTVLVHMIVKFILAALVRSIWALKFGSQRLTVGWKDYIISVAPTGLFSSIDIGFSNWGLELITVSLYTMTKSTSIIFILGFAILLKLEKKSWSLFIIVIMISIGLLLFTYKATQFDMAGFVLVLIASMCSGLRWTCVQLLLQKSKMGMKSPLDMVFHMQPFMIISLIPFVLTIEGLSLIRFCMEVYAKDSSELNLLIIKVLIGACIAFFMELSEVMVVTYTSSLTLSIAGIFKEMLILFLAVEWNGDQMSVLNLCGLLICLLGITSHVVHKMRTTQTSQKSFEFDASDRNFDVGMGKSLINEAEVEQMSISTDSDNEDKEEVLFNILNRHER